MPCTSETNNTAENTALILGARTAADQGARRLRVEGESQLVIRQVKGIYGTKSTRLRLLRNAVRAELARLDDHSHYHIDRQGNVFADRLANRALDVKTTKWECKVHTPPTACVTVMSFGSPSQTTQDVDLADVDM
ncbi:unnamed protein product [Hyaloperonospora brassicae]|uniref:RNase H type-1 domain-containing protein n=1 Tax=Hyaloperonospora brassicae TaxID=162125 RepID=A0AAV0TT42_HYABA|nr:unnamed protein product [Hyaloperonospora brassicae]